MRVSVGERNPTVPERVPDPPRSMVAYDALHQSFVSGPMSPAMRVGAGIGGYRVQLARRDPNLLRVLEK
jgi:hypothetical protein